MHETKGKTTNPPLGRAKPTRKNRRPSKSVILYDIIMAAGVSALILLLGLVAWIVSFDQKYQGRAYPPLSIGGLSVGGKTPKEIEIYWLAKNEPFSAAQFTFSFGKEVATVSGDQLELGYDATLSATQAYLVGRSGNLASDVMAKFFTPHINLTPYFRWNEQVLDEFFTNLSERINIPVQDALFQFSSGRVTAFRPSRDGRQMDIEGAKQRLRDSLVLIPDAADRHVSLTLPVNVIKPAFATDQVNSLGIKELIGRGYSEFRGSISGRIHNITLAAARMNGLLIKPGETFSFNEALGDVSATTGFQPAYIIKEGRTVLGDGGGVCQVSTTLFRAALAAGLPIVERTAHAYRVHYYEEAGFKPGIDSTVFAPSVDLKIKNDTPGYILIQSKTDARNMTLTFELYGTSDGRRAEIINHQVWGVTPPPPDLYQDDPTLPQGVVKQVDFAAWGAKTSFQYKVIRGDKVLQDTTFYSNFRPWQAVYLRGTATQ